MSERLARGIEEIAREVGGTLGVAARHLNAGLALDFNADCPFPAASVIKSPLLAALYRAAARGEVDLGERVQLRDADKVPGSGVLKEIHAGAEFTLEDLARLMIVISDNTAANLIIARLGLARIEAEFEAMGFRQTRLRRRFFDLEARERGLENEVTPRELAEFFAGLERRTIAPPAACEAMLAIHRRQQFDSKLPRLLPPHTPVAHKTGTLATASHDAGLLYSPAGPLVVAALTRDIADAATAEGALRHVGRLVFQEWGAPEASARRPTARPA